MSAVSELRSFLHIRFLQQERKVLTIIQLYNGDCLELMKQIPDKSVDMVLCDLPYGITRNAWDVVIPFDDLWTAYRRIIKDNGAICLFAQMPFAAKLVMSNLAMYKYEWIVKKTNPVGFLNSHKMPLSGHESVQVFYKHLPTYNPQMTAGSPYNARSIGKSKNYGKQKSHTKTHNTGTRMPNGFIEWHNGVAKDRGLHPTQKGVDVCEYLIKTYTNEGEVVLDNCMGSGSTGVACVRTGRDFIGMELDTGYFEIAKKRIEAEQAQIVMK